MHLPSLIRCSDAFDLLIRAARTVENGLYLVVLVLWMVHSLALYRALRTTNLAAALFRERPRRRGCCWKR